MAIKLGSVTHKYKISLVFMALAASCLLLALSSGGCRPTAHPTQPGQHGFPVSADALSAILDQPGPVEVQTVIGADWEVPRDGLINLQHPKSKAAALQDGPEPIHIYFHALRHPRFGLFLVDTGVEQAFVDNPDGALIGGIAGSVMHIDRLRVRTSTAAFLQRQPEPLAGVFLTHLHLDHLTGMRDVPRGTALYAGPGETMEKKFENLFVRPILDRALFGHAPLREWSYSPDPSGRLSAVVDIFGDSAVFALHVPGHTVGSTAYLARTAQGPVLMAGDACHTAWGWQHGVEPGSFSHDQPQSAESLRQLQELVRRHPNIDVRLGHQPHPPRNSRLEARH